MGGLKLSTSMLLDLGAGDVAVQTGRAGEIIGNNGEGTLTMPYKEWPGLQQQSQQAPPSPQVQRGDGEGEVQTYLFDRGSFYGGASSLVQAALLEPFRNLPFHLPPLPAMVQCTWEEHSPPGQT